MNAAGIRRRYYILNGSFTMAASLIWGVNTLFLLDAGLDMFEVFGVNAVFTLAMTLFEIPTGAVADSRGRRVSLIWSSIFLFIGTLGYLAAGTWGGGVPAFAAASMVLGLGFTFFSGAAEAWAVDELAAVGDEESITSLFANAATAASVTMLGGTVLGGFLGSVDYRVPYLMRAALFLVMLGLSLFAMPEKGWRPDGETLSAITRIRRTARDSMEFGFRSKALRQLMGVSFFLGVFMMWGFLRFAALHHRFGGIPRCGLAFGSGDRSAHALSGRRAEFGQKERCGLQGGRESCRSHGRFGVERC
jgi:MFS family permease